jgi:hypothetical protein
VLERQHSQKQLHLRVWSSEHASFGSRVTDLSIRHVNFPSRLAAGPSS